MRCHFHLPVPNLRSCTICSPTPGQKTASHLPGPPLQLIDSNLPFARSSSPCCLSAQEGSSSAVPELLPCRPEPNEAQLPAEAPDAVSPPEPQQAEPSDEVQPPELPDAVQLSGPQQADSQNEASLPELLELELPDEAHPPEPQQAKPANMGDPE